MDSNHIDIPVMVADLQTSFGDTMQFESVACCRKGRQIPGIIAKVPGRAILPVVYPEDLPAGAQDAAGWAAQRFKDILAPPLIEPYRKRSGRERESLLSDVILRAVSVEWSRRNPHFAHFNDAGIVGQFYLPDDENYLTEGSMHELGISIEELRIAASQNTLARFGIILADTSVFSSDLPQGAILQSEPFAAASFQHDSLYLLTNGAEQGGAALMLIPQVMKVLGDLIGSDYYVVPTSTHGVLIAGKKSKFSPSVLKKTILSENRKNAKEDALSTYIYQYDRAASGLRMLQA